MIRVVLPPQLRTMAGTGKEVTLPPDTPATAAGVIDAIGKSDRAVSRLRRE